MVLEAVIIVLVVFFFCGGGDGGGGRERGVEMVIFAPLPLSIGARKDLR